MLAHNRSLIPAASTSERQARWCGCSFKDFVAQRPLAAVVPAEDMGRVRSEIKAEREAEAGSAAAEQPIKQANGEDTAMADAEAGVAPAAAAAAAGTTSTDPGAAAVEAGTAEAQPADPLAQAAAAEVKTDADGDTVIADGSSADPAQAIKAEAEEKAEAPPASDENPAAAHAAPGENGISAPAAAEVVVSDDDVKARWQAGVAALHEVHVTAR